MRSWSCRFHTKHARQVKVGNCAKDLIYYWFPYQELWTLREYFGMSIELAIRMGLSGSVHERSDTPGAKDALGKSCGAEIC